MGADKATMLLGGVPLLELATRKALVLTQQVFVVGPRSRFGANAIEDVFPDRGPLAGIHSALSSTQTDLNLLLAVDLPFVPVAFLRFLQEQAESSDAVAIVPRTAAGWQPLCAIYKAGFRGPAEQALQAGKNKIDALFASVRHLALDEPRLQAAGFTPAIFDNLNTQADFERARLRVKKEKN